MRERSGGAAGAVLLALVGLLPAADAAAQRGMGVTVSLGTFGLGELQEQPVLAQWLDADGEPDGAPVALRRTIRSEAGWLVGGSLLVGLGGPWSLRAAGGYGGARLSSRTSGGADAERLAVVRSLDDAVDGRLTLWETLLRFDLPLERRLRPHLELGVGGVRVRTAESTAAVPGLAGLEGGGHHLAMVLGGGIEVPLLPRLVARLGASTRFFATPVDPAAAGRPVGAVATVPIPRRGEVRPERVAADVTFAEPEREPFADAAVATLRSTRLEVGLGVRLGPERPATTP